MIENQQCGREQRGRRSREPSRRRVHEREQQHGGQRGGKTRTELARTRNHGAEDRHQPVGERWLVEKRRPPVRRREERAVPLGHLASDRRVECFVAVVKRRLAQPIEDQRARERKHREDRDRLQHDPRPWPRRRGERHRHRRARGLARRHTSNDLKTASHASSDAM